jgi:hypothetical protein
VLKGLGRGSQKRALGPQLKLTVSPIESEKMRKNI